MSKFINEFSDDTQIILSNIIGIISSLIFIYTSYQSNYYSKTYIELNKNILDFMINVEMFRFFCVLIALLFSIFLAVYSIYLNSKKTISSSSIFNKICAGIGVIITIIGLCYGLYSSRNVFKLFIMISIVAIIMCAILGMLFNGNNASENI